MAPGSRAALGRRRGMAELDRGGIVNHPWLVLAGFVLICVAASIASDRRMCIRYLSNREKAMADVFAVHAALAEYTMSNGDTYPTTLDVLVAPDDHGHRYLGQTSLPRDPWGREYVYVPGNPPNVLTHGRDGVGKWDGGGRGS